MAPTDGRVSPLYGDLRGLPPILLLTGTHNLLNADAHRLQTVMATQGAAAGPKLSEYKNMLHVWPSLPIPEAKETMREILEFL